MTAAPLLSNHYTGDFFDSIRAGSRSSAKVIAPLVLDLIRCRSVVDVGCGSGTWLRVFQELGVPDITGIDGDYVDKDTLEIDANSFHSMDLSDNPAWNRTYDLALSLEVAEHLPESAAGRFVSFLTALAPVVLFSAAIPGQGGTNHLNEQWPEYWVSRFDAQGFTVIDCIRSAVWTDPNVERWYAQNAFLFVRRDYLSTSTILRELSAKANPLALVHPRTLEARYAEIVKLYDEIYQLNSEYLGLRELLRLLPRALRKAFKRRTRL